MAKISVINKQGDVLFRAKDDPNGLMIQGNSSIAKSLTGIESVEDLINFLIPFQDRILVKAEDVEVNQEGEATEDAPNMPAPGTGEEPVASEDVSSRIAPALKIIKELLSRAEQKKVQNAQIEAHVQAMKLEQQHATAIIPMDGQYYVTMDGDGIGNQVARAQYTDDERKVKEVSMKIDAGKELFVQWAIVYGGVVIEAGGDEGQVRVPSPALDHIEEFRNNYLKQVGATVTVGVGRTISESIQARELGKLRGKNQVVYFDENSQKELQLRLDNKGGDDSAAQKLSDSGVLDAEKPQPKLGEQATPPSRPMPKYGLPQGAFSDNQKKQQEYETWLRSQKKELA